MGKPTAAMQELALKLAELEKTGGVGSVEGVSAPTHVIEKLRITLTRFSGVDSFTALMRRAVALTRAEDPTLASRTITRYDSVASFEELSYETVLMVTGHLLDLMSTFVGKALTLKLIADTWPGADL